MTRLACYPTVSERLLSAKQSAACINLRYRGRASVKLVRLFFLGAVRRQLVDNRPDLFGGKIAPVGHPLPLEFAKEFYGNRVSRLDHARGRADELHQPLAFSTVCNSLEIRTDFGPFTERMACQTALAEGELW